MTSSIRFAGRTAAFALVVLGGFVLAEIIRYDARKPHAPSSSPATAIVLPPGGWSADVAAADGGNCDDGGDDGLGDHLVDIAVSAALTEAALDDARVRIDMLERECDGARWNATLQARRADRASADCMVTYSTAVGIGQKMAMMGFMRWANVGPFRWENAEPFVEHTVSAGL